MKDVVICGVFQLIGDMIKNNSRARHIDAMLTLKRAKLEAEIAAGERAEKRREEVERYKEQAERERQEAERARQEAEQRAVQERLQREALEQLMQEL